MTEIKNYPFPDGVVPVEGEDIASHKHQMDLWASGITVGDHTNIIECYGETQEAARLLRDFVLSRLSRENAG